MKRLAYLSAGWLMVVIGIIGLFLPVMPTTIFLILAAWCFSKSSPRFEEWLLSHPIFGPSIRNWRETGAISAKAKALAASSMAVGFVVFWFVVQPAPWLALTVAAILAACATFVLTRPTA